MVEEHLLNLPFGIFTCRRDAHPKVPAHQLQRYSHIHIRVLSGLGQAGDGSALALSLPTLARARPSHFYRALLSGDGTGDAAAALRSAMVAMIGERKWSVQQWAGFVVYGL